MKFLLALFGFFFFLFTAFMAVLVWKVRKRVRAMRDAMENGMDDEAFQRMADKNYYRKKRDQGPVFDEEYFKGDPNGSQRRQQQARQSHRTTHTVNGYTIVDNRDPSVADKKIFAQDEGEYVDFTEA